MAGEAKKKRERARKRHIRISRILYVMIFVTIQAAAVILMLRFAWDKMPFFYVICGLLSVWAAVHIVNRNNNPAFKMAWLIPIMIAPIFGGLLYVMFGSWWIDKSYREISAKISQQYRLSSDKVPTAEDAVRSCEDSSSMMISSYLTRISGCLPYGNTETSYFPSGEALFPVMMEVLRGAKRYIFLEYFIIEEGIFWNSILEVLREKVSAGVDVRVIFDDFGSMLTLPRGYENKLRRMGIRCEVFSPFNTILSPRPNNRDHRKICVVDGVTGITGGINLADEYINRREKYGYWKDTALVLHGDAAWGMTVQFLGLWEHAAKVKEDYADYLPVPGAGGSAHPGIVQPYTDIPLDSEQVGLSVYFQMITRAKHYVYIMTPYLILDHELLSALQIAAKSGVDVRIITPHRPDKKTVFFLTRSYYKPLLDAGVKIFEFTPGFVHAKVMVSDDSSAVVGSINLDFRSLYLHLENAVFMYKTAAVEEAKRDFEETQALSKAFTEKDLGKLTWFKRLWLSVLRTFAPLI